MLDGCLFLLFPVYLHETCGADMAKLTAAEVKNAGPGKHQDGSGLYLRVTAKGSKSWTLRITVDGKRRDIGLGSWPEVSLADARRKTAEHRSAVAEGRDPLADKRRGETPTFRQAAQASYEMNLPRWRNERHAKAWWQTLETYAMPTLGDMAVDRIHQSDVLGCLTPIWATKPETARRVRQRIRAVLRWAMAHGYVEHNAAGEAIDGALPAMPKVKNHHRALHYAEVAGALAVIDASGASTASKLCFRFIALTAARSGEARNATWGEIGFDTATWTVPAGRMKANAEHRVPLSGAALEVLDRAKDLRDGSDLIFPSPLRPGHPISNMTLTELLKKTGLHDRATIHGLRSSARTFALEQTDAPWAVAEAMLAHTLGDQVQASYIRGDLFDRRRQLMDDWAAYIASQPK